MPVNNSSSPICRFVFFCLFTIALLTTPNGVFANDSNKEQQLTKLKEAIRELRKELEATKSNRDRINKTLESTEKNIGELNKKAREIETQLKERQQKVDKLREERSELNNKKRTQENIIGQYVSAAFQLGQQGNIRLILNQEDPSRVSRNLKYYDYFVSARARKISEYTATISRINDIEPEIAYQTERIRSNLDQLEQQKSKLKHAQQARKTVLTSLNIQINSQDQRLRTLHEDRRQLQKLLSIVIDNIADIKPRGNTANFSSLKGKLPWPTKGRVIRKFGSNRIANKLRWEGLLIASQAGNPVQVVHYGRVIFSDYLRGHGLLMIIDHGAGFMSLYAHNQALYKELGEWVESGDVIASVGNSGGQQDSALYFELRYQGKPTNPQSWFRRA